ncbi:MAG: SAM-dependent methyltransferase [Chloroflexi bacterium]|nr:SAM-dependent methyltransferase [Chloroflexota bacterium]
MSAESEVRRRIQERVRITFAAFMEIALYWPRGGYYTSREPIGAHGDYYTSPAVHPAFGALLAVQLYQMWQLLDRPAPFTILEPGAGSGLLCRDISSYAKKLPGDFAASLHYVCLDRRIAGPIESGLAKTSRVLADGVPFRGLQGCVLSNEYLDAFPVHQVVMTTDGLKEVYIGLEDGKLVELTGEPSDPRLAARFEGLGITLAQGQTAEVNLTLDRCYQDIAAAMDRGFVLSIDYGRTAQDLYDPERRFRGTLVTYQQHIQTDSPLTRIGSQDITAQVDFTSAAQAGEDARLDTLGLVTQREFLSNLNLDYWLQYLRDTSLLPRQMQANRAGILDLVRPEGLGDFKILAQGKNVGKPELWGLNQSTEATELVKSLPVPTLTDRHISLPDGRSSGSEVEFEAFWPLTDSETSEGPDGMPSR